MHLDDHSDEVGSGLLVERVVVPPKHGLVVMELVVERRHEHQVIKLLSDERNALVSSGESLPVAILRVELVQMQAQVGVLPHCAADGPSGSIGRGGTAAEDGRRARLA